MNTTRSAVLAMPSLQLLRRTVMAALVTAVMMAGVAMAPTAANAHSPAEGATVRATAAMPVPQNEVTAYNYAYRATLNHYRTPMRQAAQRDWGFPDMPGWIKEGTWWIKNGAKCAIGVGAFVSLAGGAKVAAMLRKIAVLSKSSKNVMKVRVAARKLGGFPKTLKVLGRYAKSRGKDVTRAEKAAVKTIVINGGSVVASILGISSCFAMVRKVI